MIEKNLKIMLDRLRQMWYSFFMVINRLRLYYINNEISDVTSSDIQRISNKNFLYMYNSKLYV
jgi:hypothetical protein